jgi:hypothetical protein
LLRRAGPAVHGNELATGPENPDTITDLTHAIRDHRQQQFGFDGATIDPPLSPSKKSTLEAGLARSSGISASSGPARNLGFDCLDIGLTASSSRTARPVSDLTVSPSRASAFEDHTQSQRDSRREINRATLPNDVMGQASSSDSPRARKQRSRSSRCVTPAANADEGSDSRGSPRAEKQSSTSNRPVKPASNSEKGYVDLYGRKTSQSFGVRPVGARDTEMLPMGDVQLITLLSGRPIADPIPSAFVHSPVSGRSGKGPANVNSAVTPTIHDLITVGKHRSYVQSDVDTGRLLLFDYSQLTPEVLPAGYTNITYHQSTIAKRTDQLEHLARRLSSLTPEIIQQLVQSGGIQEVLELAKFTWPMFPRVLHPRPFSISPRAPPICRPRSDADSWPDDIPMDVINHLATKYLSREDVRNLRLVNKPMCEAFSPIYFRSLVTRFGEGMFTPSQQYGDSVNKFGISFDVDLPSLYHAKPKISQETQQSWWGDYEWPKPAYQRFPELQALEELVDDNKPFLKKILQYLRNASELALSLDSGHGWLNGPDLSDMQAWDMRNNGSKIFGKTFAAANKQEEHLRNELFRWAQQNTINQSLKYLVERSTTEGLNTWNRTKSKIRWLESVRVRDYNSFELESDQHDHHDHHHTGGPHPPAPNPNQAGPNQLALAMANASLVPPPNNNHLLPGTAVAIAAAWQAQLWQAQLQLPVQGVIQGAAQGPVQPGQYGLVQALPGTAAPQPRPPRFRRLRAEIQRAPSPKRIRGSHIPQWPLIFNGYNLAAEVGGQNSYIQEKIADPGTSPLKPGHLSEAQAQWLMETFWAQRAFLSAYTTSVILNKGSLRSVHALNIAKLSSGLLPLLEQDEFWRALSGLRKLAIIISPDWRREHIPGDQSFQTSMLTSPVNASIKLTDFLRRFICNLENLSELTVGFVGGGEHAPGMLARNQHVLPAPITQNPRSWVSDHGDSAFPETMISFNHIKDLKFENCWFSPCMLRAFLEKSRDTSLRRLTLDSVSLTAYHATSTNALGSPTTPIEPQHGTEAWLNETLPNNGCWPAILDAITPGMTFLEQKDALGFYLNDDSRRTLKNKSFRGNVKDISLNSCGYVYISGVTNEELNQSELLRAQPGALDDGLFARKSTLQAGQTPARSLRPRPVQAGQPGNANVNANPPVTPVANSRPDSPQDISGRLMMSTVDPYGQEYFGLGTLTQAVHPVEKRVLEQSWGMQFGWGDDMKRWSAVDDGCYEGGTGRFSGSVLKSDEKTGS